MSTPACIIPWISLWPKPDGSVYPCCAMGARDMNLGNLQNSSLKEIFQGDKMNRLRRMFLAGQLDEVACSKCVSLEQAQGYSMRSAINQRHLAGAMDLVDRTDADGRVDYFEIRYSDFSWSNKCNFTCSHCNPNASSSIGANPVLAEFYSGGGAIHQDLTQLNPKVMDEFLSSIDNLEVIHFNGGEPFMIPQHYEILKHLIQIGQTDVFLWFHTNGSTLSYKGQPIIDLLTQFSKVKISMSHDAFGARGDFVRRGYSDAKFLRTAQHLKGNGFILKTSTAIHALNIWHLPELFEWYETNGIEPSCNAVVDPRHIAYDAHDSETRAMISEKLMRWVQANPLHGQVKTVSSLCRNLLLDKPERDQSRLTEYLEIKRNEFQQDAWEVFPELRKYFNSIGFKPTSV